MRPETRGALAFSALRLKGAKFFDNGGDGVFAARHTAALELVGIDVADQRAQSFQVLAARARLVIIFYEWSAHKAIVNGKREIVNGKGALLVLPSDRLPFTIKPG